jgi:hypothetical protein
LSLILFLVLVEIGDWKHKKPAGVIRRRAWVLLLGLSGRLHQAMAVRRHGNPMMMVVTVMAVALHLLQR